MLANLCAKGEEDAGQQRGGKEGVEAQIICLNRIPGRSYGDGLEQEESLWTTGDWLVS